MSKSLFKSEKLKSKKETAISPRTVLATQSNTFNSVFDPKPLDDSEDRVIQKLLVDNYIPGKMDEDRVPDNVNELIKLTMEIKAIGRQEVVLMGERVHKAREMLKPYRDGTFTKWLETAFGTRKTGYNALSYFELYKSLPDDETRKNLKRLPLRAAYVLASRQGDPEKKLKILRDFHDRSHEELLLTIREMLPVGKDDSRKKEVPVRVLLNQLNRTVKDLERSKKRLDDAEGV